MLITLSELQRKEVVMVHNGKRLGHIVDLDIDEKTGYITAVIIIDRQGKGAIFQKPMEIAIAWQQIVTIGTDIILVQEETEVIQKQAIEEEK